MSTVPLNESASVTLVASGNGTVRMRPFGGGETWLPASVSFKASSNTLEAQCRIYIGPSPTDQYFVDGSLSGSTGDSTGRVAGYQVDSHGNYLWAVWTGGDVGATATLQVIGTEVTPGSGSPFDLSALPTPSSGCSSPLVGGGGALVYPSIHSPDFSIAGQAGWAILKNGSAYFFSITAEGTITATQFTGTDFVINASGEFFYSGPPAAGNLLISRAIAAGTDAEGNAYLAGDTVYGSSGGTQVAMQSSAGGITFYTASTQAGPWTSKGAVQFTSTAALTIATQGAATLAGGSTSLHVTSLGLPVAGDASIVSGRDGSTYDCEILHLTAQGVALPVSSTTPAVITGLSCIVAAGTYQVRAQIICTQGATAAVQKCGFSGPAISGCRINATSLANGASVGASSANVLSGSGMSTGVAFGIGATWITDFRGWVTFTAGGTLALCAAEGTAGDPFTVVDGTMDLEPIA